MSKYVLMMAHTFPPLGTVGGSIRLLSFLKYLKQGPDGWKTTVLTVDTDRDLLLLKRNSGFALAAIPENVRVLRAPTLEPKVPRIRNARVFDFFRKLKLVFAKPLLKVLAIPDAGILWQRGLNRLAQQELGHGSYDLIYVTGPPFSALFMAAKLAKKSRVPLVLDIKDDWVSEERYGGKDTLRRRREQHMERTCIESAASIITVTDISLRTYRQRYPEYANKFICIPNGCDLDEFKTMWAAPPAKLEIFTIVHAGGLGGVCRDASGLFQALAGLLGRRPEMCGHLQFLVFGHIGMGQQRLINKLGLQDVVKCREVLDRGPYVELLARAHLPVAINVGVPAGTIPGKLYEYWASRNRQLLLESPDSAAAKLVSKYDIGDVVMPYDDEGIARVIEQAWDRAGSGKIVPVDTAGLEQYDRQRLTGKLEEVFHSVAF